MVTDKPVVAVIGSGYWGKNLIRIYHEMGALKLICDNREPILKAFKEQYAGLETCVAANDIYGDPDIDGVVIATPAETHFTIAREALHCWRTSMSMWKNHWCLTRTRRKN